MFHAGYRVPSVLGLGALIGLGLSATAGAESETACRDGIWQALGFQSRGACHRLIRSGDVLVWNPRDDFQVSPNQENPNRDANGFFDVWHFLSSAAPYDVATYDWLSTYQLLPPRREGWGTPAAAGAFPAPLVGVENTLALIHPGRYGERAILGWRSPITGVVNVVGDLLDRDAGGGDGVSWMVEYRGTGAPVRLIEGTLNAGSSDPFPAATGFRLSVAVTVGDFIDIVVDPRENFAFDTTLLDLTIVGPLP